MVQVTIEQKSKKARVRAERRSGVKLTTGKELKKARVEVERRSVIKLIVEQNCERLELNLRGGLVRVRKPHLSD
jgi:hypothetical protein